MGKQEQISLDTATSYDAGWNATNTDAAKYITALLGELHSIASISGLSQLSEDIHKYCLRVPFLITLQLQSARVAVRRV